jgi:NADH dehydrogenase
MSRSRPLHAVTGAFGYSGGYIARRLIAAGEPVITLTNSLARDGELGEKVRAFPLCFDRPGELEESLREVGVLYNTYWVRFNHRRFTHAEAVRNTLTLFESARRAGVERIVHVSITNPSESSPLEYFRGKAVLERALGEIGISYAILRPTVLFGREDILINNIAWVLRHLPVFGVFGDGRYRLQPVSVEDFAALAVGQGARRERVTVDAIGPETYSYRDMVRMIAGKIGVRRSIVSVPPRLGLWAGRVIGAVVRDVVITGDEIEGLMSELLYVGAPPAGGTRLSEWVEANHHALGRHYASELRRRDGARSASRSLRRSPR